MRIKKIGSRTSGQKFSRPKKRQLHRILPKRSGRNASGKVTTRHQGDRQKRFLRKIDFKRDKKDLAGRVVLFEYDPNRTANIALVVYPDGEKRYILAPVGLKIGDQVMAGSKAEIKTGNALPLQKIPVGSLVHNLELFPGKGGQIVRGAGTAAVVSGKEDQFAILKLPSGQQRRVPLVCTATLGQVSNVDLKSVNLGKAGRKRHLGIRPTVRGVVQHPGSHPHGGGEGKSGIGMPSPKSPWGKKTLGKRTRKKIKYSDKLIIKKRK
jgi:large subunit ribosomal protein L2